MTVEKSGEFRGKTIEIAISTGLDVLRLSRDEVEIEVVRPGSRGVLGIGAEDAIVRLTAQRVAKSEPKPAPRLEPRPEPRIEPKPTPKTNTAVTPEPKPATTAQPRSGEGRQAPPPPTGDDKALVTAQKGRELLEGLLAHMGLRATVEVVLQSDAETEDDDRSLVLNIVGDDLGVLIGRQNETLSAVEFVTRLMVNQQTHTRTSFIVDVNGYRAKRAEALRRLALRMAEQVAQSGRMVALEPMSPAERRIIHLALRDHPAASTQSVGEGDRRKVTIIPKK